MDDLYKMNAKVTEIIDLSQTFNLLEKNKIEGFACLETVGDHYLNSIPNRYQNIQKVYPPLKEKPYYLMLSHQFVEQHPQLSKKIWKTIQEVKTSKSFKHILQKYQQY